MAEVIFNGPEGRLEGRYQRSHHENAPAALILHPHPEHGGTMNNKVTYAMYRTFTQMGFHTLRFNFRGVGRSEGVYDNGEGELCDAACAMDWLQAHHPQTRRFWVGGFSFGAWIALQLLMRRPELNSFVAVSPPAGKYDFSFLAPCPVSGLIIQGTQDEVVKYDNVTKLITKLRTQKNIFVGYDEIVDADHFFTQKLKELCATIENYVYAHEKSLKPEAA
jgi:hypothetical protein